MSKELKVPNLGENISSAEVLKVLVQVGDTIQKEQSVLEISSDKATLEIPSDFEGTVKEIKVKEGDSISEGQTIFVLDSQDTNQSADNSDKPENSETNNNANTENAESKNLTSENKTDDTNTDQPTENNSGQQKTEEQDNSNQNSGTTKAQFLLPNLGENISSAEVLKVLVQVGDTIQKEQSVLEISSDKATLEVPSTVSGTITDIKVKEGQSVKEGDLVLELDSNSSGNKPNEDSVKKTETPKQTENSETNKQPQEKATDLDSIEKATKKDIEQKQVSNAEVKSGTNQRSKDVAPAAPSVRRFAREIGIDIQQVSGTGPSGRISIEDVKTYSKALNKGLVQSSSSSGSIGLSGYKEALPDFSKWGEVTKEQMNNVRFKTAQHLSYAWNTIPHVTNFDKVDITDLEKLRKEYGKKVEAAGGKLTMTSILLKIIAAALKVFPKFGASIDLDKKEIIYKNYVHLGVAVDTDRGLLVPVIKDADKKNITQISVEVSQMAQKARDKKLTLDDMQGAVFTISNLGGIGGVGFTPVVNSPEVAILGVSKSSYEPVYIDGNFEPRLMMPLSLSYDHRLIDGADAARFMKWLKEAIENPFLIILEG